MQESFRSRAAAYVAGILGHPADLVEITGYSPGRLEFTFLAPWGDTFQGWTTWRKAPKINPGNLDAKG